MPLKVLDCTLRDGGYYNNWDFSQELVKSYLNSIGEAGVDVIEIGFRMPPQNGFCGAFAYSSDDFLRGLPVPDKTVLAVMINASDIITHPLGVLAVLKKMFASSEQSPVGLVRIATHLKDIPECHPIAEGLKELGYRVALNMMQVGGKSPDTIASYAREVQSWGTVDVLYFADSLGNMGTKMVEETIAAIKSEWSGDIGIHAHDNMGRAVANTISAIELGATWLDGTVLGMGRGAGNARVEYLLAELTRSGLGSYHPESLFDLVLNDFSRLRQKHKWGGNLLYYLSAMFEIHPTYVQLMLADNRYQSTDIVAALNNLREMGGSAFCDKRLTTATQSLPVEFAGSWSARGWADGHTVLLVGPGQSVSEHMDGILDFIDRAKPLVLCINAKTALVSDKVSAYVTCRIERLAVETRLYLDAALPLVTPTAAIPKSLRDRMQDVEIFDYGICVEKDRFEFGDTGCTVPVALPAAYALALATAAGAERILLAGFDGFAANDSRQEVMISVFELYRRHPDAAPVTAITPTSYSIPQSSVYALEM